MDLHGRLASSMNLNALAGYVVCLLAYKMGLACWLAGRTPLLYVPVQACLPGSGVPCDSSPQCHNQIELCLNRAWLRQAFIK